MQAVVRRTSRSGSGVIWWMMMMTAHEGQSADPRPIKPNTDEKTHTAIYNSESELSVLDVVWSGLLGVLSKHSLIGTYLSLSLWFVNKSLALCWVCRDCDWHISTCHRVFPLLPVLQGVKLLPISHMLVYGSCLLFLRWTITRVLRSLIL